MVTRSCASTNVGEGYKKRISSSKCCFLTKEALVFSWRDKMFSYTSHKFGASLSMHHYHCTLVRLKLISNTTSTWRLHIQRGDSQHHIILAKSEEGEPVSLMVVWSRYLPLIQAVIASLVHDAEIKQLSFLEGTSPSLLKSDSSMHATLT